MNRFHIKDHNPQILQGISGLFDSITEGRKEKKREQEVLQQQQAMQQKLAGASDVLTNGTIQEKVNFMAQNPDVAEHMKKTSDYADAQSEEADQHYVTTLKRVLANPENAESILNERREYETRHFGKTTYSNEFDIANAESEALEDLLLFDTKSAKAYMDERNPKPSSTIGKLMADRENAVKSKASKEVIASYDSAIEKAKTSQPLVKIGDNLPYKIPTGFMLKDPNDPSKGLTPIKGGPKDSVAGDTAAKAQMLRTAQNASKAVSDLMFDKNGTPNWTNIVNASTGTPKTDGRRMRTQMEYGIQAITRLETGAAMPPEEVKNTRKRFQPSPFDDSATVNMKLQMFNEFINGTLKLLDPSGRFNEERFDEELSSRASGVVDFDSMSDEELLQWGSQNGGR